jgi:hypothetical protein
MNKKINKKEEKMKELLNDAAHSLEQAAIDTKEKMCRYFYRDKAKKIFDYLDKNT